MDDLTDADKQPDPLLESGPPDEPAAPAGAEAPGWLRVAWEARRVRLIWLPLSALALASVVFMTTGLDLWIASLFHDEASASFPLADNAVVVFLYEFGTWPTALFFLASLIVLLLSVGVKRLRRLAPVAAFGVLALLLGPGLLVNEVFKKNFGRPRPVQVEEFGGPQQFRPLWEPGRKGFGGSFASGHASMGFFWLSLGVYFSARRRPVARIFLCLGLAHGCLMGLVRMSAGAHFASDVTWAAGFVWIAALVLDAVFRWVERRSPGKVANGSLAAGG